jgi:hypothetical protein
MLRSLLVNYPAPIDLTQDEEVLFPDIQKYVILSIAQKYSNAHNDRH